MKRTIPALCFTLLFTLALPGGEPQKTPAEAQALGGENLKVV